MKKKRTPRTPMSSPTELISDLKKGKMVILVDDESRENEGDLILAADFVSAKSINFMATHARGLICLALSPDQVERLKLPMMVSERDNSTPNKTAFTVSIEASFGVTTGISAADRAHTVWVASRPTAKSQDVRVPGHIFPLKARSGGVRERPGHTEASVDLAKAAGLNPAAVICEVMNADGSMARVKDLKKFAMKHRLKMGTIEDLIQFLGVESQNENSTHKPTPEKSKRNVSSKIRPQRKELKPYGEKNSQIKRSKEKIKIEKFVNSKADSFSI
jgi:3,4-dihydroxy 2-butanone 4-phosphate synthase/GTP cyclohydrolase II